MEPTTDTIVGFSLMSPSTWVKNNKTPDVTKNVSCSAPALILPRTMQAPDDEDLVLFEPPVHQSLSRAIVLLENRANEPTELDRIWHLIRAGYARRVTLSKPQDKPDAIYSAVYFDNRLERACSIIASNKKQLSTGERLVPMSVLEELRILPMNEKGVVDYFCPQSKSGMASFARILSTQKETSQLYFFQKIIRFFMSLNQEKLKEKIHNISRLENYIIAMLTPDATIFDQNPLELLKVYFGKDNLDEALAFIANTPLMHFIADAFSLENMVNSDTMNKRDDSKFWMDHFTKIKQLLEAAKDLKLFLESSTDSVIIEDSEVRDYVAIVLKDLDNESLTMLRDNLAKKIKEMGNAKGDEQILPKQVRELCSSFYTYYDSAGNLYRKFGEIDFFATLATLIEKNGWCFPTFVNTDKPLIGIKGGRCLLFGETHPVYTGTIGGTFPPCVLLTGLPGSGKSILINIIGTIAHLSLSLGIAPAQEVYLAPMQIVTSCNIRDSIANDLSLFKAQAKRMGEIMNNLNKAKENELFLVILDEPITSTSAEIANSMIAAFMQQFELNNKVMLLLATHYSAGNEYFENESHIFQQYRVNQDHTINVRLCNGN